MPPSRALLLLLLTATSAAAETVLGAFVFARHGDRTAKTSPPTELTALGYRQAFRTGEYYRSRYVADNASAGIQGLSPHVVDPQQLAAAAPSDDVLQKSAMGFLQGLYPPVGSSSSSSSNSSNNSSNNNSDSGTNAETLRDGTVVDVPLDGYQLVSIGEVTGGKNSEDAAWLQGTSKCPNAKASSNAYLASPPYADLLDSTADFYSSASLAPMLEGAFSPDDIGFENAYLIFDYLNVASVHNSSDNFHRDDLFTDATFDRTFHLASVHQFNLAWNASDPIRAVAGSQLANDTLTALSQLIETEGDASTPRLNVQFGPYATFLAFFGLVGLSDSNANFTGIPDYASSMAFELITDVDIDDDDDGTSFPDPEDINVRFLFRNGSAAPDDPAMEPTPFSLFGQSETVLPWPEFRKQMEDISFRTQEDWCTACGSTDGPCASLDVSSDGGSNGGSNLSLAQAGVIGAMVTLAVVAIVQGAIFLVGGFRLVRKSSVAAAAAAQQQREIEKGSIASS